MSFNMTVSLILKLFDSLSFDFSLRKDHMKETFLIVIGFPLELGIFMRSDWLKNCLKFVS